MAKIRNVPFPRPCGATGNDAQKLHAPAFAHFRGAVLRHEVFCPFSAEHTANQAVGFTMNQRLFSAFLLGKGRHDRQPQLTIAVHCPDILLDEMIFNYAAFSLQTSQNCGKMGG